MSNSPQTDPARAMQEALDAMRERTAAQAELTTAAMLVIAQQQRGLAASARRASGAMTALLAVLPGDEDVPCCTPTEETT